MKTLNGKFADGSPYRLVTWQQGALSTSKHPPVKIVIFDRIAPGWRQEEKRTGRSFNGEWRRLLSYLERLKCKVLADIQIPYETPEKEHQVGFERAVGQAVASRARIVLPYLNDCQPLDQRMREVLVKRNARYVVTDLPPRFPKRARERSTYAAFEAMVRSGQHPSGEEWPAVIRAYKFARSETERMWGTGETYAAIADHFNALGFLSARGDPWTFRHVQRLHLVYRAAEAGGDDPRDTQESWQLRRRRLGRVVRSRGVTPTP